MQALVLTAGIARRLRPLSYSRAKAVLPVAGAPLIHRILDRLAGFGIRDVVLNLHHRPETITREIGDGSHLGVRVRYSWENPLLGSAGGPRQALSFFDCDPFLIVNGDTLTDLDLDRLLIEHHRSGARVTMAVIPNPDPEHYGGVRIDGDRWVTGFTRPGATESTFHFIGAQVTFMSVFEQLPAGYPAESVGDLYPRLMRENPHAIRAFVSNAGFYDIGTPGDYLRTSLALASAGGNSPSLVGEGTTVHPTAHVEESVVWDRVTVESSAHLVRCVVTDDVRIPAGSEFQEVVILRADGRFPESGQQIVGDLLIAPLVLRPAPVRRR